MSDWCTLASVVHTRISAIFLLTEKMTAVVDNVIAVKIISVYIIDVTDKEPITSRYVSGERDNYL